MDSENKKASPLLPHQVAEIERVRSIDRITINFSELTKDQRDMMDDLDRLSVPVGAPVEREKPSDPFMVRVLTSPAVEAQAVGRGWLDRHCLIEVGGKAASEMLGIMEIDGRQVGNQGAGGVMQAVERTRRLRQTCADAAWFLWSWRGFAWDALIYYSSYSIIRDARRHGFVPDSDREHVAGRVVKWELIDAARAILAILDHPTMPVTSFDADRLRKALEDL